MNRAPVLRLAALALLVAAAPLAFADESVEIYRWIYRQADTFAQKNAALTSIAALDDPSVSPILAEGLAEMVRIQASLKEASDRETMARLLRLLVQTLGEAKYVEAAEDCWAVVEGSQDPLTRAEALIALGKMRALEYSERIALMLRDINMNQWPDKEAAEKVAFGCVLALGKLKDLRGFSPVFFAANGWYGKRVRDQALQCLPSIVDDPTEPILAIIRDEDATLKLVALNAEFASRAQAERKAQAAVAALLRAREQAARDKKDAASLAAVRALAIKGLIAYKSRSDEAVPALAQCLKLGELDERLLALQALGSVATDAAATVLRDYIIELNEAQKRGLSDETRDRLAKAAIANAGYSRNKIVRPALMAVQNTPTWSGSILQAAVEALKALQ